MAVAEHRPSPGHVVCARPAPPSLLHFRAARWCGGDPQPTCVPDLQWVFGPWPGGSFCGNGMGGAPDARNSFSFATVSRVWRQWKLQPWRVEMFKLSTDPELDAKIRDVVGLYPNPPQKAVEPEAPGRCKRVNKARDESACYEVRHARLRSSTARRSGRPHIVDSP